MPEQDKDKPKDFREYFIQEVQDYLSKNPYPGFSKPFHLEGFAEDNLAKQTRPHITALTVILHGIGEEDISSIDHNWLQGLYEIGQKWETELRLPHWYFEK